MQTITSKLNALGYYPKKVAKSQPQKIPETDAIFEQVTQINHAADAADDVCASRWDAKATVKVGPFARGGKAVSKSRLPDHDFALEATVTPVGIFLHVG